MKRKNTVGDVGDSNWSADKPARLARGLLPPDGALDVVLAQLRHLARTWEQCHWLPHSPLDAGAVCEVTQHLSKASYQQGHRQFQQLERDQCACFFYRVQLTKSVPAIMRAMALPVAFTSCQISYSKAIPPPLPPPPPPHLPASRHPPCPHRHPRTSSLLMRYVLHQAGCSPRVRPALPSS